MNKQETNVWFITRWRPLMAYVYTAICLFDFVIMPTAFSILQVYTNQPLVQWQPITLQGAGLIHMAFGAVIGIATWGRTKEKILEQGKE